MNHSRKKAMQEAFSYLTAILVGVVVIIPFLWMLSTSLKNKGALIIQVRGTRLALGKHISSRIEIHCLDGMEKLDGQEAAQS